MISSGCFIEVHWKNLAALCTLVDKAVKEGNKKYDQLECVPAAAAPATKSRLLNEMEDQTPFTFPWKS